MKLVSIIIPYNNDRGWLNEAIESVKNQTYPNIELILSHSDNGVSYNINRGIEKAKGEYIKFFAEDDLLTPNCIEDSVKAIEGFDFIHGNAHNFNLTGKVVSTHKPKIKHPSLKDIINHNHIHGGTLMYRKDVFERFGMFDESLWTGEEYEYNLRILSMGAKLNYLDKVVFNYRFHPKQKSIGNKAKEYQNKRKIAINEIKEKYSKPLKIVVAIATFKGREETIKKTIKSLVGQCDEIRIYNNEERPVNLTDNGKFFFLQEYKEPVYYLTCDDDIIYPPTYIEDLKRDIERTGGIVTHHGRKLIGVDRSYYRGHKSYQCLIANQTETIIDVAGTGVTGFRTDYFNPTEIWKSKDLRMSDLVFSNEASKQGKKITVLRHRKDYFKYQNIPNHLTIHGMEYRKEQRQIEIANEIFGRKK